MPSHGETDQPLPLPQLATLRIDGSPQRTRSAASGNGPDLWSPTAGSAKMATRAARAPDKTHAMRKTIKYSDEPADRYAFTRKYDVVYTRFARAYDLFVKGWPGWRRWLSHAVPHLRGPRVLEISFGPGFLLTRYADQFETYGIDYNYRLIRIARQNLGKQGISANLQQANVEALPYGNECFDSLVNTMAFSSFPDGRKAMAEMHRVLRPGGRLIMIDVNYPRNRNWLGVQLTKGWALVGDLIRDMGELFTSYDFLVTDQEIGGFGSIHLYIAEKKAAATVLTGDRPPGYRAGEEMVIPIAHGRARNWPETPESA